MFFGKLKNSNVLEMFDLDLKNENSNSDYNAEEELRKSISSFQMAFISSNLNNLSSPIQSAFLSSGTVQLKARYAYVHFILARLGYAYEYPRNAWADLLDGIKLEIK